MVRRHGRQSLEEVLDEAEDDEEEASQEAAALKAKLKEVETIAKEAKKIKEAVAKAKKIKDKVKVDEFKASLSKRKSGDLDSPASKKVKWTVEWASQFLSESQWDYLTTTMGCVNHDDGSIIKSVRIGKQGKSSFSPALVSALTEFGIFKE